MGNPFDLLLDPSDTNKVPQFSWATVQSANSTHITVKLDGSDLSVPVPVNSVLIDPAAAEVDTRVLVLHHDTRLYIMAMSGGDVKDKVAPLDFLWISTGTHSHNTTWALAATLPEWGLFNAGSKLKIFYHVPYRNDSGTEWGGLYIEPQIRLKPEGGDWGDWRTFGTNGYGLMISAAQDIVFYNNTLLFTPDIGNVKYSIQLRYYMRSYDNVTTVNTNNDLHNVGSGTATRMTGDNGNQNYFHTIVEEKPQ